MRRGYNSVTRASTMKEEFFLWLSGIEEDDPLPYEIGYVYFCVHRSNGGAYFAYYASENEQSLALNFDYFPLDGQYFYHEDIEGGSQFYKLRSLVEDFLNSEESAFLKNKKIYIAEFGKPALFDFYSG